MPDDKQTLSQTEFEVSLNQSVERERRLEAALRQYADPRNWAISRDDLNYRVVSWIGPGAEKNGMPDPMEVAKEALGYAD